MEAAKLGLGGALMLGLLRRRPSSCSSSSSGRAAAAASSIVAVSNNHRFSPAASFGTRLTTSSTPKEKDLVFVAGATGRVGSRAVRELIKLGFRVRAAVRDAQRASALLQSVQQLGLDEKLEIVECDLEKQAQEGIVSAIGNAAVVVCSIGASEKEILDVTGPYRIDYMATNSLVQAATAAKVEHFILVTSLGTNKIGFPAFLLNLFWGVLCWKRRAEEALIASGIPYTIVRPGGMERPTDAYKETHNLVVAAEDTYVGGQVSNLQVAELIAYMASNRKAAYCKVVEVIAETTAPPLPFHQLLSTVPSKREPPAEAVETPPPPPAANSKPSDEEAKTEHPLSPYTAYEGLKPPSSPSPIPASSKRLQVEAKEEAEAATSSPTSSRPLSPYAAFVDLKPPSTPSPSSSSSSSTVTDTTSTSTSADASSVQLDPNANGTPVSTARSLPDQVQRKKQQRPLSPYTRYEELKPPSSPTPSAPKI